MTGLGDQERDIRWLQGYENLNRAFSLLERTLQIENPTEAEEGGIVHFHEICFELSWKLMKSYLEEIGGYIVSSPREAIKIAFQSGLISNGADWMQALEDRNLTTHTYNEETAADVIASIRAVYSPLFREFLEVMKEKSPK